MGYAIGSRIWALLTAITLAAGCMAPAGAAPVGDKADEEAADVPDMNRVILRDTYFPMGVEHPVFNCTSTEGTVSATLTGNWEWREVHGQRVLAPEVRASGSFSEDQAFDPRVSRVVDTAPALPVSGGWAFETTFVTSSVEQRFSLGFRVEPGRERPSAHPYFLENIHLRYGTRALEGEDIPAAGRILLHDARSEEASPAASGVEVSHYESPLVAPCEVLLTHEQTKALDCIADPRAWAGNPSFNACVARLPIPRDELAIGGLWIEEWLDSHSWLARIDGLTEHHADWGQTKLEMEVCGGSGSPEALVLEHNYEASAPSGRISDVVVFELQKDRLPAGTYCATSFLLSTPEWLVGEPARVPIPGSMTLTTSEEPGGIQHFVAEDCACPAD